MALTTCKECGKERSKNATSCPHCGAPVRRTSFITWVITIILVIWLIGYIGSFSGSTSPRVSTTGERSERSAPVVGKMGETLSVGYTSYAVWKAWYSDRLSRNEFMNQRPDATYLFIDLSVRNSDTKARSIPPFKLIDENGAEHETTSKAWSVEGAIGVLESLNPTVTKRGIIVFDVPKDHHYKLKVSGGYWSGKDALIDVVPE